MNILMMTNTYLPHLGGVARSVDALTEDLRSQGNNVLVIAPTFEGGDTGFDDKQQVYRLPAIQNFNGSDFSVRIPVPFALTKLVEEFSPDIIHSHHPFLLGDTALRISRQFGLPLVFTHHTRYEMYTHYVPLDSSTLQQFAINLATEYANLCDLVIAPSDSIEDLIRSRGVKVPINTIPTGVDLKVFSSGDRNHLRHTLGVGDNELLLGHVGRLAPEKNLIFLANAVAKVITNSPNFENANIKFVVAGDGPSRDDMEEVFSNHGIEDKVTFLGNCRGQQLSDCFAAMDLFLFTSFSETQGMVLTEAMAASTPVVALNAPGAREVVIDNYNGCLLPEDTNEENFSNAIMEEIGCIKESASHSRQALATAKEFSRESVAKKIISVYQGLLDNKVENAEKSKINELENIDMLVERIKIEWELISQKLTAAFDAISDR